MTTDNCITCGARIDHIAGNYKIDLNLGTICDSCDFGDDAAVEQLASDLDAWTSADLRGAA